MWLAEKGVKHRVLVVGEGPARPWLEERLPDAVYAGHPRATTSRAPGKRRRASQSLGHRSVRQRHAGSHGLGTSVIAVNATGATNLVSHGVTGFLAEPGGL
jgi:hypothetical protein